MLITELNKYDNSWYNPGGTKLKRCCWYFVNTMFVNCRWNPSSKIRIVLLRLFGAIIGKGVVIKPAVNIKYPWNLSIGDYSWIGESVWIDNLAYVKIGKSVCISQGAMLLCGNHNYKRSAFDLIVGPIVLEDGAWAGSKSVICPGVIMHTHSVLMVGSVATHDTLPYSIYRGNPAVKIADR